MEHEILTYEHEILTNQQIRQLEHPEAHSIFTFREWDLTSIIGSVLSLPRSEISLRWVGNSDYSLCLSFFYCAFRLCILKPQYMLHLKHNIYRIGQYYLSLAQQKSLAQFLTSLSDGVDVAESLCENRNIEFILIKLVQTLSSSVINSIIQLEEFVRAIFPFINVRVANPHAAIFNIQSSNLSEISPQVYIFQEKMCSFVCEPLAQSKIRLKDYPTHHKIEPNPPIEEEENEENSVTQSDIRMPPFLHEKVLPKLKKIYDGQSQEDMKKAFLIRKPFLDNQIKRLLSHTNLDFKSRRVIEEMKNKSKSRSKGRNSSNQGNMGYSGKNFQQLATKSNKVINHRNNSPESNTTKNKTNNSVCEDMAVSQKKLNKKNGVRESHETWVNQLDSPISQRLSHNEKVIQFSQKQANSKSNSQVSSSNSQTEMFNFGRKLQSEKAIPSNVNQSQRPWRYSNVEEEDEI